MAIWSKLPAQPIVLVADLERAAAVKLKDTGTVVIGTVLPWLSDDRHSDERGEMASRLHAQRRLLGHAPTVDAEFSQSLIYPCAGFSELLTRVSIVARMCSGNCGHAETTRANSGGKASRVSGCSRVVLDSGPIRVISRALNVPWLQGVSLAMAVQCPLDKQLNASSVQNCPILASSASVKE